MTTTIHRRSVAYHQPRQQGVAAAAAMTAGRHVRPRHQEQGQDGRSEACKGKSNPQSHGQQRPGESNDMGHNNNHIKASKVTPNRRRPKNLSLSPPSRSRLPRKTTTTHGERDPGENGSRRKQNKMLHSRSMSWSRYTGSATFARSPWSSQRSYASSESSSSPPSPPTPPAPSNLNSPRPAPPTSPSPFPYPSLSSPDHDSSSEGQSLPLPLPPPLLLLLRPPSSSSVSLPPASICQRNERKSAVLLQYRSQLGWILVPLKPKRMIVRTGR